MKLFLLSICLVTTLSIAISGQISAKTFTYEDNQLKERIADNQPDISQRLITLELTKLTDNAGLEYIGAIVPDDILRGYLSKLKQITANRFLEFRSHQQKRDHHQFHVTVINPYEYQRYQSSRQLLGKKITVELYELGTVSKEEAQTYFVIVTSTQGQLMRESLGLPAKDFHITLGFAPNDIYGVSKGKETIINLKKT
ncbi:hypothetical protein [Thalassotalea ganghwensis]